MAIANQATYAAIPLSAGQVSSWKTIPIQEPGRPDPLVPLGPFSTEAGALITSSTYFGEHSNSPYITPAHKLEGSLLTLFARRSIAKRLLAAERLLPPGHHLLLLDAYRPYQVQASLHAFFKQQLIKQHPEMDDEALEAETQKYVSVPSTDPTRPSPHNTGGTVDLAIVTLDPMHEKEVRQIRSRLSDTEIDAGTRAGLEIRLSAIIRRHAAMLNFGTPFDHGSERAALTYYEAKITAGESLTDADIAACNNRRLLFKVMTEAGFQPYFAEWWHFNAPETQMGAAAANLDHATFGAMELDRANMEHEEARRMIYHEALKAYKTGTPPGALTALQAAVVTAVSETGDPTLVKDWPTEMMAPTRQE